MSGSLRGVVPGMLCLLELLEHPSERDNPNHPHHPNGVSGRSVGGDELGEWDRALLRLAAEHHLAGRYTERAATDGLSGGDAEKDLHHVEPAA